MAPLINVFNYFYTKHKLGSLVDWQNCLLHMKHSIFSWLSADDSNVPFIRRPKGAETSIFDNVGDVGEGDDDGVNNSESKITRKGKSKPN